MNGTIDAAMTAANLLANPKDMTIATSTLADILKRRGIRTIYYFHTDHYEPWSSAINDKSAQAIDRFATMSRQSRFGRKLSLFYAPFVAYELSLPQTNKGTRLPGEHVTFLRRRAAQEKLAQGAIGALFADCLHELHLHVHHEFWTCNDSRFDKPVTQWVNAHSTPEADSQRLDLFIRLCKEVIAQEVGKPLQNWAFIHGNWALAASDPLICKVENELAVIMAHGGFGDFSFPAGRGYCDPKLEMPFTCLPLKGIRAYDDPAADARPLIPGKQTLRDDRFFIWNSPIKATYSSLDYYASVNRDLFRDPARILDQWLEKSVVLGDSLFIKTHAHSMKWEYEIGNSDSRIPHCYPDIVSTFEALLRVCDKASVDFQLVTVNEVMDVLQGYEGGRTTPEPVEGNLPRISPGAEATDAPTTSLEASETRVFPGSSEAKPPAAISAAAFRSEFLTCQRVWKEGDGASQPADELFSSKLARGVALETYEAAVAEKVLEHYRRDTPVLEIGSGYGALALLLALNGFRVLGYDGDRRRSAAASWHVARYMEAHPELSGRIEVVRGYFPAATYFPADLRDGHRLLAIATNVTCTYTANNRGVIFDALARHCGEVILDLARFGMNRNSQKERDELREELSVRGFQPVEKLYTVNPYEYWRFQFSGKAAR